jgi:hypothetical protein
VIGTLSCFKELDLRVVAGQRGATGKKNFLNGIFDERQISLKGKEERLLAKNLSTPKQEIEG